MTTADKKPAREKDHYQGAKSKAEKDRLAKALRQNLLRRKSASSKPNS